MRLTTAKEGMRVVVRSGKVVLGKELQTYLDGKEGIVYLAGNSRPRIHGVLIEGTVHWIPAGNLEKVKE